MRVLVRLLLPLVIIVGSPTSSPANMYRFQELIGVKELGLLALRSSKVPSILGLFLCLSLSLSLNGILPAHPLSLLPLSTSAYLIWTDYIRRR